MAIAPTTSTTVAGTSPTFTLPATPHGDYVPVSGNGRRLLLHGFSRLYAVDPKRR